LRLLLMNVRAHIPRPPPPINTEHPPFFEKRQSSFRRSVGQANESNNNHQSAVFVSRNSKIEHDWKRD
jgi:hypothetical protein